MYDKVKLWIDRAIVGEQYPTIANYLDSAKQETDLQTGEVKDLFGVDVASNRYSLKSPPRNSWKVDELFKSNGANE